MLKNSLASLQNDHLEPVEQVDAIGEGLTPVIRKHLKNYFATLKLISPSGNLYPLVMQEVEKVLIQETLKFSEHNQSKASEILGINRNTLRKKMTQFHGATSGEKRI